MENLFQQILNKAFINPKALFLIDGCGALLSTFLLGVILVKFETHFGMPKKVLYPLALVAGIFMLYSFTCYFRITKNWKPFLKTIAFANLTYSIASIVLIIYFFQKLTSLGLIYFILEIAIILILSTIEFKTVSKN